MYLLSRGKYKIQYDKTINTIDIHVGNKILTKNQTPKTALDIKWLGTFEVIETNDMRNIMF